MMILSMTLLTGCLGSRVDLSDIATGTGAVVGAAATAATGLPPIATVAGALGGATAGAVLVDEPESTADTISKLPEEERAAALKWLAVWDTVKSLGFYAIGAVLAFFLIPLLIGYFLPNGQHRKLKRMAFDNEDIKMKDI